MPVVTPTVLVLGAAASSHLGYPLGQELIAQIVRLQRDGNGIPIPQIWEKGRVDDFVTRLSRSAHFSIDAFLESVPDDIELGKYLITYCLKRHEDIDRLFPPHNSGWYQYLFNSLLNGRTSPLSGNSLTIVTYNYDRSIEAYLYHALIGRFAMTHDDAITALQQIPIVHVHGTLGDFPCVPYGSTDDVDALLCISKSINIIHEIQDQPDGFSSESFRKAHEAITQSQNVFFLGFGFHPDNIRRLQVKWALNPSRKVRSTFWDTSPEEYMRLISRLHAFGLTMEVLPNTGGYGCDRFFRNISSLE